jgi:hypothetical protein
MTVLHPGAWRASGIRAAAASATTRSCPPRSVQQRDFTLDRHGVRCHQAAGVQHESAQCAAHVVLGRRTVGGLGSEESAGYPPVAGWAEELDDELEAAGLLPSEGLICWREAGAGERSLDALVLGGGVSLGRDVTKCLWAAHRAPEG